MRPTSTQLLVWTPRLLGLAVCLFLGLFALDAFDERQNLARSLADFAIHLLPVLILVTIVLLSWRRPGSGGSCSSPWRFCMPRRSHAAASTGLP